MHFVNLDFIQTFISQNISKRKFNWYLLEIMPHFLYLLCQNFYLFSINYLDFAKKIHFYETYGLITRIIAIREIAYADCD